MTNLPGNRRVHSPQKLPGAGKVGGLELETVPEELFLPAFSLQSQVMIVDEMQTTQEQSSLHF